MAETIAPNIYEDLLANPDLKYEDVVKQYANEKGIDPTLLSGEVLKFKNEREDKIIQQQIESDKFTYAQKQDLIKNALENKKFTYQQQQDLRDYQFKLEQAKYNDTKLKYDDWVASGMPGTYTKWLMDKQNSNKPATADQEKNAGFALRMKDSNSTINVLTEQWKKLGYLGQAAQFSDRLPNVLKSSETQQMEQAQRDFINSVLRRESGAAISPSEFDSARKQYFPQPGDGDAVLAQKAKNRITALQGIANASGPALSDDFKNTVGKTIYTSVQQVKNLDPDTYNKVLPLITSENLSEADTLQLINSMQEDVGKTEPLSMGANGSIVKVTFGNKPVEVSEKIASPLQLADAAFFKATGKHLIINEGLRSHERQAMLYQKYKSGKGGRAAPPGQSFHETGNAVDVGNWKEAEPYLRQYGFKNNLADDKNHFSIGEFS
jgi:hypothetical protein